MEYTDNLIGQAKCAKLPDIGAKIDVWFAHDSIEHLNIVWSRPVLLYKKSYHVGVGTLFSWTAQKVAKLNSSHISEFIVTVYFGTKMGFWFT